MLYYIPYTKHKVNFKTNDKHLEKKTRLGENT